MHMLVWTYTHTDTFTHSHKSYVHLPGFVAEIPGRYPVLTKLSTSEFVWKKKNWSNNILICMVSYMCMCPYIHTPIHAYTHTCIYQYMHTPIHHTRIHAYNHISNCVLSQPHIHTHTHTHTLTHTHKNLE